MSAVSVLGWTRPRHQGAASIGGRAVEQLDAADEVGALRGRHAPPSQLIQVLGRPKEK